MEVLCVGVLDVGVVGVGVVAWLTEVDVSVFNHINQIVMFQYFIQLSVMC